MSPVHRKPTKWPICSVAWAKKSSEVLRAYLQRWKFEVGVFFDGVDAGATDGELLRIAPRHPVFRISATP